MTLAELGQKVNLSTSHLSQIENNKTSPSLTTLLDIARALEVEIRYFFETQPGKVHVHRALRGKEAPISKKKIDSVTLTHSSKENLLDVMMITIQPGTHKERIPNFNGEYFYYLLSGSMLIRTKDELIELNQGDSIHFDGLQESWWENPNEVTCVIISGKGASTETR